MKDFVHFRTPPKKDGGEPILRLVRINAYKSLQVGITEMAHLRAGPESRSGVRIASGRLGQVRALGGRPGVSTATARLGKVLMLPHSFQLRSCGLFFSVYGLAEVPGGAAERHRGPAGAKRQDHRPESRPAGSSVSGRLGQVWVLGGRPGPKAQTGFISFSRISNTPFLGVKRKTGTFLISREKGADILQFSNLKCQ